VAVLVLLPGAASGSVHAARNAARTPVVLFPGYAYTRLGVTVRNQTVAPDCPRSGTFEDWFKNPHPSTTFSQVCRDKLLTLRYDPNPDKPMPLRFTNQRGVSVAIVDFGKTESAPGYEPMYKALEGAGYVRNQDIRVAGYNAQLTPGMDGFLERTIGLIEQTYRDNGETPVHLVGHSNGPLYAQYLLTHTTRAWRDRYIHGFTPIAGNFPGSGFLYAVLFTGFNVEDFSFPKTKKNAQSSARLFLSSPSSYMSAADPRIFGARETVVEDASTGRKYTPRDYVRLLTDAGLPQARQIADYYIGFVEFADPASFPTVDVSAEKGSGTKTAVGAVLPHLSVGQVLNPSTAKFFIRDGDVNQEDITNNAVLAWQTVPCFHVSLTDNPRVDHFSLPGDPGVLSRLVADIARKRSSCPG
jgi:lysophospholipase-3